MEVEIERRVDDPARWSDPERRRHHTLAEAGDDPRCAFDARVESLPVGGPIEDRERNDRRAKDRVLLDVPHERVFVAHMTIEPLVRHARDGSAQRACGYRWLACPTMHSSGMRSRYVTTNGVRLFCLEAG